MGWCGSNSNYEIFDILPSELAKDTNIETFDEVK